MFGFDKLTSGKDGRKASMAQEAILGQARNEALGLLDGGARAGLKDLGRARTTVQQAGSRALGELDGGYAGATGYLHGARDAYTPYAAGGTAAFASYQDALGLNGADGAARARSAFQAGPGYRAMVDDATDAAARKASALGMTASGNTLAEIAGIGARFADQEWDDYLTRLDGASRLGYDATGQQAGTLRSLADLASGHGRDRATMLSGTADKAAGIYGQSAGIRSGTAGTKAQLITNAATQLAEARKGGMLAGQQAAANRAGLAMAGLQLGASILGGATGGGGLGSVLGGFGRS